MRYTPAPAEAVSTAEPAGAMAAPQQAAFGLMVQLAASRSAESAEAEWRRLRQHAPQLTFRLDLGFLALSAGPLEEVISSPAFHH